MPNRNGNVKSRQQGKRKYIAKEKRMKKQFKRTTVKDMEQDYDMKVIKKKVDGLTANTRAWQLIDSNGYGVFDTAVGQLSQNAAVTAIELNILGNNIGVTDLRVGDSVTIKNIKMRYSLALDPLMNTDSLGSSVLTVRVMVLCVYRMLGAPGTASTSLAPTWNDIFQLDQANTSGVTLNSGSVYAQYNVNNAGNIKVYYDKIHQLNPSFQTAAGVDALGQGRPNVQGFINIVPTKKNSVTLYNQADNNEDLQDIMQNAYFLYIFSDNIAANTDAPRVLYNGILRYEY